MEPVGSGFLYYGYIYCLWKMELGKIGQKKTNGVQEEKDAGVTSCL